MKKRGREIVGEDYFCRMFDQGYILSIFPLVMNGQMKGQWPKNIFNLSVFNCRSEMNISHHRWFLLFKLISQFRYTYDLELISNAEKILQTFSLVNLLSLDHTPWFLFQILPMLISIIWRYNYLSSKKVKSVNSYLISPWSLDLKLLIFVDICNKQNQEEIILIERCRAETALLHKTDVYVNINRKVLKGF